MKHFKVLYLSLLTVLLISCQFFETEKISSETFIKEEIKSINWKDVDQYPVFSDCENITDKSQQKKCFESTLTSYLYQSINSENTIVTSDLNEHFTIDFEVDEKGRLSILTMNMDSLLIEQIPLLETSIIKVMDSLQPIAPAYKRGIPVKTTFKLPLVIKTTSD